MTPPTSSTLRWTTLFLAFLTACEAPEAPGDDAPPAASEPVIVPSPIDLVPDGDGRVRVLVRLARGADPTPIDELLAALGARIGHRYRLLPDLIAVRALPDNALDALARVPGVAAILPDRLRHVNLAQSRGAMRATPAELAGFSTGAGVRVCVLDTGLNKTHPAFAGAVVAERDFVNDDSDATDDQGHGTNVAGIIASRDATWGGVAPGASLVIGKVLSASGSGSDADIIAAIEWCTLDAGADVINMSLGGGNSLGTCDADTLAAAVNASVDAGVVNVIAAGNDGEANSIGSPGCARRAVTVGATYDAQLTGTRSWCIEVSIFGTCTTSCTDSNILPDNWVCFSNRALKIDVTAPGCDITAPNGLGSGTDSMCGTSQATPHVAGLVARLLGQRPELGPNDVRAFLWRNAVDRGPAGFDVSYGHGRVDALATLGDDTAVTCDAGADCGDGDPCSRDTCQGGFCAHRGVCDDGTAATADSCVDGTCTHAAVTVDDGRTCTTDTLDACLGPRYTPSNAACHDTCAEALPLPLGVTVSGTTTGGTSSLASTCPGSNASGLNVVYRVWLRPDQPVTFEVAATAFWDPALYLVAANSPSACDLTRCHGGTDATGTGQVETLTNVRVPFEGWYFLVVDSTSSSSSGTFTLSARATCDPEDEGRPCDDGNACTGRDVCAAGVCVAGPAGRDCNSDGECVDTDPCNGVERCVNELCQAGTPPTCADSNPCTSDACVPDVGCANLAVANGTPCADANLCNGDETCQAGACATGTPPACDDGNPCTADSCSATLGCRAAALPDGASCADADLCDGAESCRAGACSAGTALACSDADPCTANACDPALGCTVGDAEDGTGCSDGDSCTDGDTCQAGLCHGGVDICRVPQLVMSVNAAFVVLPDLVAEDEDLVRYDLSGDRYALYFDGSDVGLATTAISAVAYHASGDLVLAFATTVNIPGLVGGPAGTTVEPRDLVRFSPTSLGETTAGTFTFFFDGSDVDLSQSDEVIDALAILPDGTLILSTAGEASVTGVLATFHDLLRFTPSALGADTAGTWSLYFDGSDVELAQLSENVDAVSVLADGTVLLSTSGNTILLGLTATDADVLAFSPTRTGPSTAGDFSLYFDGSALGLAEGLGALEWRMLEP